MVVPSPWSRAFRLGWRSDIRASWPRPPTPPGARAPGGARPSRPGAPGYEEAADDRELPERLGPGHRQADREQVLDRAVDEVAADPVGVELGGEAPQRLDLHRADSLVKTNRTQPGEPAVGCSPARTARIAAKLRPRARHAPPAQVLDGGDDQKVDEPVRVLALVPAHEVERVAVDRGGGHELAERDRRARRSVARPPRAAGRRRPGRRAGRASWRSPRSSSPRRLPGHEHAERLRRVPRRGDAGRGRTPCSRSGRSG